MTDNNFESLINELNSRIEAGEEIGSEDLARIKAASDASPLRQELASLKAEAAELRKAVRAETFKAAGVRVAPEVLNIPEDLKDTDPAAVRAWALEAGILTQPEAPDIPDEEKAALSSVAKGVPPGDTDMSKLDLSGVTDMRALTSKLAMSGWHDSRRPAGAFQS